MKAITHERYGSPDVLGLNEVVKATPADSEVLIRVHAASVNAWDWRFLRADPFMVRFMRGLLKPSKKILGADVAGRVEAVGTQVTQFKPGDEIFGELGDHGGGAFAEYVCAPEEALAHKPASLSFEEAAALPVAAAAAWRGLHDVGQVQPGQKVLINGASGGVGSFAVQIAKALGAEVTGVCSTRNLDLVRSLGADHVIDYTQEDFTRSEERYDLILAVSGFHPISAYKRALSPTGIYVMAGGSTAQMLQTLILGPWIFRGGSKRVGSVPGTASQDDLISVRSLVDAGEVTPLIDRRYPLSEVPDAIRYLQEGHARGKVVIKVNGDGEA